MSTIRRAIFTATFAALASGCVAVAQEGPVTTTALINVESKKDVPLDPAMLTLQVDGKTTPINSVRPVKSGAAQVAILIDDGLRGSFGNQLQDIAKFVTSLPPGMQVLIGYMRNGEVTPLTKDGFTTDHVAAVEALRIPISAPGISASPYFCLSEFVKHWPSNQPAARFVLMLTNGVDPYNGSTSIMNQDSPYVQTAQEDAQRNGVAVYSIYYGDSGMRGGGGRGGRGGGGTVSGQNYLSQVAEATGGESFWNGMGNPVALAPFLENFNKSIAESYTVSFMASAVKEKANTLDRFKLKTSQPGIKIHAPDQVHPGTATE
jgi:hypothetical protein